MSKVKKIIGGLLEGSAEFVKKSAEQLVDTVSPGSLIDSALGTPKKNEVTEYLRNLGDKTLTPEQLAQKSEMQRQQDEAARAKILSGLTGGLPSHMKVPAKPTEQSKYDTAFETTLESDAAKKKAPSAAIVVPVGQERGKLGGRRKPKGGLKFRGSEGIAKDTKIG